MELSTIKTILQPLDIQAYYYASQKKEQNTLACKIFSKIGQKKYQLESVNNGKSELVGRNDIISRFIFMNTNIYRARKQVSSHIQVWANCKKAPCNREIDNLVFKKLGYNFKAYYVRTLGNNGCSNPIKRQRLENLSHQEDHELETKKIKVMPFGEEQANSQSFDQKTFTNADYSNFGSNPVPILAKSESSGLDLKKSKKTIKSDFFIMDERYALTANDFEYLKTVFGVNRNSAEYVSTNRNKNIDLKILPNCNEQTKQQIKPYSQRDTNHIQNFYSLDANRQSVPPAFYAFTNHMYDSDSFSRINANSERGLSTAPQRTLQTIFQQAPLTRNINNQYQTKNLPFLPDICTKPNTNINSNDTNCGNPQNGVFYTSQKNTSEYGFPYNTSNGSFTRHHSFVYGGTPMSGFEHNFEVDESKEMNGFDSTKNGLVKSTDVIKSKNDIERYINSSLNNECNTLLNTFDENFLLNEKQNNSVPQIKESLIRNSSWMSEKDLVQYKSPEYGTSNNSNTFLDQNASYTIKNNSMDSGFENNGMKLVYSSDIGSLNNFSFQDLLDNDRSNSLQEFTQNYIPFSDLGISVKGLGIEPGKHDDSNYNQNGSDFGNYMNTTNFNNYESRNEGKRYNLPVEEVINQNFELLRNYNYKNTNDSFETQRMDSNELNSVPRINSYNNSDFVGNSQGAIHSELYSLNNRGTNFVEKNTFPKDQESELIKTQNNGNKINQNNDNSFDVGVGDSRYENIISSLTWGII
ncbi:hypothetical protein BB559_006982 [Furculomyces boomerangus]|uniref:TEA domain-containing protein n=1 Tax=Furculomyces boomerangus TaxID=61424 RepID=A0A2T9XZK4_9FUNG|nr:hypothetical protein BB559_006982 [Furculomyces boomerangus]